MRRLRIGFGGLEESRTASLVALCLPSLVFLAAAFVSRSFGVIFGTSKRVRISLQSSQVLWQPFQAPAQDNYGLHHRETNQIRRATMETVQLAVGMFSEGLEPHDRLRHSTVCTCARKSVTGTHTCPTAPQRVISAFTIEEV